MKSPVRPFSTRQKMLDSDFEIYRYRDSYLSEVELHHHDFYEVYFFLSGSVTYIIESRKYQMKPGDVLLISPLELHQPVIQPGKEPYERVVLWVNRNFLKELSSEATDLTACFDLESPRHANLLRLDAVTARVGDETLTADLRYVIATAEKIANGRYGIAYAPSLVRGQGYYTGMVFEVTCPQFSGAVAGGGRYDNMVGKFIGQQVPAVGFSIGFERVCGILLEQDYQIPGAKKKLALLYLKDADFAAVLAKADALRAAYDVTVLPQAKKLGKQFGTLEAAGYNAVAFADNDDIKVLGQKAE